MKPHDAARDVRGGPSRRQFMQFSDDYGPVQDAALNAYVGGGGGAF